MSYLSPGVYVKEVSGGVKPIAGAGTSMGAFVGIAEKGVIGKAVLVTNWSQFVKEFGSFIPNGYLAYGVYSFFVEGGTSCFVVRVATSDATASLANFNNATPFPVLTVEAKSEGSWGNGITIEIANPSDESDTTHFKLTVTKEETATHEEETEVYDNISIADIEDTVNDASALIKVIFTPDDTIDETPLDTFLSGNRPVNTTSTPLENGEDGISGLSFADYISNSNDKNGIHAFDEVDNINIVAIPDSEGDTTIVTPALTYCKNRGDCFFIADSRMELEPKDVITDKGSFNSSYGALYYPWVYISDPLTGKKKLIPPSGAVAGTYAYTDSTRGVHKAPAGIAEGYLDSVVGIERIITKGEHDLLNPAKINVIRSLPEGICIWGARTLSADSEWLYINVRRLLLFIEESIDKGTQWVVFEPNDPTLWGRVKRNITAFLLRVWRDGALFGTTQEEAFFVKVDEENNPPEVRDAGQLIIEVGVAPVKPAEFVIIKISQKTLSK